MDNMAGFNCATLLIIFVTLSRLLLSHCGSIEDETFLQDKLLVSYSSNVRPNDTMRVTLTMVLKNLINLDIVEESMLVSGSLAVQWNDYRLTWRGWDYNKVTIVYFTVDEIWRPLLVLANGADAIYAIGDDNNQRSIPIVSTNVGVLFWNAPAFFNSICSIDVSLFPFDTQTCEVIISSWMFDTESMLFDTDEVLINQYEENGEYHLVRTYSEVRNVRASGTKPWSYAVFGVEFQRRYSYYVINMVMPVLFLEVLGVLVFALPASSGEKLSYALTLLLSLVVMVGIVAEKIPSTSLQVPLLSIYILEGVALSVMEVLLVVYILKLRSWHEAGKTLGPGHTFLATVLVKRSCWKRNKVHGWKDEVIDIDINQDEKVCEVYKEKVSISTDTAADLQKCTFKDIAEALERFSFWLSTFLVILFNVQAVLIVALK